MLSFVTVLYFALFFSLYVSCQQAILAKKSHNTPICVYGVCERLGMDLTEFVNNSGGAEQKHVILVMEDYFSRLA